MSLVVAIKHKNRFILGADKQASLWNNKQHTATKVWRTIEYKNCCIGSVGLARASQVIQYIKGLLDVAGFGKDQLDEDFNHLQLPRTLYETLKMHGVIAENSAEPFYLPNEFFIAYKDRCWQICQDLSVNEIEEYEAIGSGADIAAGVIETALLYKEKNPFAIIAHAIDIAAEKTLYVDHEIDFVATADDKNDIVMQAQAFGYDTTLLKQAITKDGKVDLEKLNKLTEEYEEEVIDKSKDTKQPKQSDFDNEELAEPAKKPAKKKKAKSKAKAE